MTRGTGQTTEQLRNAPHGAIFVWCNDSLSYPRQLAAKLKRGDLRIVGYSFFDDKYSWRGITASAIVLDHAGFMKESIVRAAPYVVRP